MGLIKAEAAVEERKTEETEEKSEEDAKESGEAAEKDGETTAEKTEEESTGSDVKDNETKTEEEPKKKKKTKMVEKENKRIIKKSLEFEAYYVGKVQPLTEELMEESRAKLAELTRKDKERVLLEEAKNRVESYIYHIKNKLIDDEENIAKISTEEQREELRKLAEDGEEWLYDDGYNADLSTMEAKYVELSEPAEKVWFRLKELTLRPEAIESLKKKLTKVEGLLEKFAESMPQITDEEKNDVKEKIEAIKTWMSEKETEQASKEPHEDPAFTSHEVPLQTKSLERLIAKLMKKPKPKPEKKENETKAEPEAGNETDSESDGKDGPAEGTEEAADDKSENATEEESKEGNEGEKEEAKEGGEEL